MTDMTIHYDTLSTYRGKVPKYFANGEHFSRRNNRR